MSRAEIRNNRRKQESAGIKQLCDDEKCATCGKLIPFGISMMRNNYQFKRQVKGKVRYYCKYSCQTADEKKDPPDKRRKWSGRKKDT